MKADAKVQKAAEKMAMLEFKKRIVSDDEYCRKVMDAFAKHVRRQAIEKAINGEWRNQEPK